MSICVCRHGDWNCIRAVIQGPHFYMAREAWWVLMVFLTLTAGCRGIFPSPHGARSTSTGDSPPLVSTPPPLHPREMRKAGLSQLKLEAFRTNVVLGEPVVLIYTAVADAEPASAVYEEHPRFIPLLMVVGKEDATTVCRLAPPEHAQLYYPAQIQAKGVGFERADMWGTDPEKGGPWQPLFEVPGTYRVRARFEKGNRVVESNAVEITVRSPSKTEMQALQVLQGGPLLWAQLVQRGPAREDPQALFRIIEEFAQTPYAPYALFGLAYQTLQRAWSDDDRPVENYPEAVKAAEKIIKDYPTFCFRDDVWYALLKSWGCSAWLHMQGISPKEKDPQIVLPHLREFMEMADQFVREYPHSPLRPEVEKKLAEARRYVKEHGG